MQILTQRQQWPHRVADTEPPEDAPDSRIVLCYPDDARGRGYNCESMNGDGSLGGSYWSAKDESGGWP